MSRRRQRKLDTTVTAIQKRHGPQAIRRGMVKKHAPAVPHFSTGFPALDAITGCKGIPLGGMTLISGRSTSGKLTLGYKALTKAQEHRTGDTVALIDLFHSSDPDYLKRCGMDLKRLVIVRPPHDANVPELLVDLARTGELRAILVDNLGGLLTSGRMARRLHSSLGSLGHALRAKQCSVLLIGEPEPPWQRWTATRWLTSRSWPIQQQAALCIEMQRERWLRADGALSGYRARACVTRSRWRFDRPCAMVEIEFNGAVRARATW